MRMVRTSVSPAPGGNDCGNTEVHCTGAPAPPGWPQAQAMEPSAGGTRVTPGPGVSVTDSGPM